MMPSKFTPQYSPVGAALRRLIRGLWPIPGTPDYSKASDICQVELLPQMTLIDQFEQALRRTAAGLGGGAGAYLEFGVFNGFSLSCMAEAAHRAGEHNFQLVGVDSFKGLPAIERGIDNDVWVVGQFECSREDTERCLRNRQLDPARVHFVEGWYEELDHDDIAKALGGEPARIVMIDCDTYPSACLALELLRPFLAKHAVIFFDDWRLHNLDLHNGGEYRAFHEFLAQNPDIHCSRFPSYSRKSEAFLVSVVD